MDNLTATVLHSMIHEQFEKWNEQKDIISQIEKAMFHGCTEEDSRDEIYAKMLFNTMELAADIAAKVILEILIANKVVKPSDESLLRKKVLSVVKEQIPLSGINGEGKKTT